MEPITGVTNKKYHRWADSVMSPGVVGSVGDVLVTPFLKTSCIDLPRRVQAAFAGANATHSGANISDGDLKAYTSHGLVARTVDSAWNGNRSFRDMKGWLYQDLRAPDKMVEPYVSSLGDYSWRNTVATVEESFRTGALYAKLPGEFSSSGVPRGGAVPRITEFSYDDQVYNQNAFMPVTDEEAAKPKKPIQPVMNWLETAGTNMGEALAKTMTPLTADEVKEFEKNSPMTQYDLKGL